jgi:hypothetical protein
MAEFAVAGRTGGATAATADNVGAELWNPHGTRSLYVKQIIVFLTAASACNLGVARSSAKGTSTSTVTPDADSAYNRRAVPATGCTLELDFSAEPTLATPYLQRATLAAIVGGGMVFAFGGLGLEVPAGTGIVVATPVAVALPVVDVTFIGDD